MLRMHEREYPADSWMVRRWDEWCERHYMGTHKLIEEYVSDGRGGRYPIDRVRFFPRDPHSFCEFWRTVTLYYTLEQLGMKLANRLFSEEYVEEPVEPKAPGVASRALGATAHGVGRVLHVATTPLRLLGRGVVVGLGATIEFVDSHRGFFEGAVTGVAALAILVIAIMAGYVLYQLPWSIDVLLAITEIIGFFVGVILLILLCVLFVETRFAAAIGRAFVSGLRFLGDLAYSVVVQKNRVCPPMKINRE